MSYVSIYAEVLGLTALLGIAATLAGRLLVAVFQMRLLRRPGPESLFASSFLGTALLTLTYGWASYCGLPARGCLLVVGLLLAGLTAFLAFQRRLGEAMALPRPRLLTGLLVVALVARVTVYLLPLTLHCSCLHHCDIMIYSGTAEWLQGHGFSTTPGHDAHQPFETQIQILQDVGHRMGPMFLLALVRAAIPGRIAIELFPVVLGWGAALNVAGVFLLARWGLRVPRFHACLGTAAVAVAMNSLSYSSDCAFLCQVYGTGMLAFGLALLSRLRAPLNWCPAHALLLGMTIAALVSTYSEMSPVMVLAALVVGGEAFWRARRGRGRPLRFAGLTLLALLVLGNVEYVRAARALPFMMKLTAGGHIDWSATDYVKFALGFSSHGMFVGTPDVSRRSLIAFALAAVAFLLGLARTLRYAHARPLTVAVLVFTLLAAYYRFHAHDPWTGELGHTWSLFKISKWVFTLVAALQVAGLSLVLRRMRWPRTVALLVCVAVACTSVPAAFKNARALVTIVRGVSGPDVKLSDLRRLGQHLDAWAPQRFYLVSEPSGPWPRCFAAFLLYPRPFANGWKGSVWLNAPWLQEDLPEAFEPGTLYFQHGVPPFAEPVERLPFGYSIVDGTRPLLFRIDNPNGVLREPTGSVTWLGTKPIRLFVFSPRACHALLSLSAAADLVSPLTARCLLRVTEGSGQVHAITLEPGQETTVGFPVSLTPGVNQLELQYAVELSPDLATASPASVLRLAKGRVEFAEQPSAPSPTASGTN
jgi:hypothetical protein